MKTSSLVARCRLTRFGIFSVGVCFLLLLLLVTDAAVYFLPVLTAKAEEGNHAAASSPKSEITSTLNLLVGAVEQYPGDKNRTQRRQKLREIINPRFDFEEMAKRSLGAHWNVASEAEQKEFVNVFSDLLASTYLNRIETIEKGMVKVVSEDLFKGQQDSPGTAVVRSEVTAKGSTFPITYKLIQRPDHWEVYDVAIENIGLVANYRNEFAGIVRKEKLSGLIQRLLTKNSQS